MQEKTTIIIVPQYLSNFQFALIHDHENAFFFKHLRHVSVKLVRIKGCTSSCSCVRVFYK